MSRPRIPPPPKREIRRLYEREGLTCSEVADRCGVSERTVRKWLVMVGVRLRPRGNPVSPDHRLDAEMARLWRSGVIMPEIARRYGVTKQRVHQRIARHRRNGEEA